MRKLFVLGLLALASVFSSFVAAQETKGISWKHGLSFQVRKPGQTAFEGALKFGAEVFLDKDLTQAVYIDELGNLSVGTANKLADGTDVKAPLLFYGLEARVRKVGEASFDKDKVDQFSAEVFKDTNGDNLVYISNTGSIAVIPAGDHKAPEKVKDPVWYHGMELKVRKAGDKEFDDKTPKFSIEVYKDENTNQLLYFTNSGQIAVVAAGPVTKPTEVKGPTWYHAFEVKARTAKEEKFSKDTKTYGVEVYKDPNANTLIYISETGSIAVVPAGTLEKPSSSKEPTWKLGRAFRVRKADEPDFNDMTKRYGAEVYKDENANNLVYITETGAINVIPAK